MGYYGRGYYRNWRSRGWKGSASPSKYSALVELFGGAVEEIRHAFMALNKDALNELFYDYGAIYGGSKEKYARRTFPNWKSGARKLSGQTMERLIELVPPYLTPEQRFSILRSVLKQNKKRGSWKTIKINVKEPTQGFVELQLVLDSMEHDDVLAHLPECVMEAASWLYDDDITAGRAMLAEAERLENDIIRSNAARDIKLFKRTILSGQVKAASYSVEMPAGKLNVVIYTPSCFVATVCFGASAPQTTTLRRWRDQYLVEKEWGRKFIVWYYNNGENISKIIAQSPTFKRLAKACIVILVKAISYKLNRRNKK
jgi:hypothetical protein